MSHLGRPEGRAGPAYSLAPVADRLAELLGAGDVALRRRSLRGRRRLATATSCCSRTCASTRARRARTTAERAAFAAPARRARRRLRRRRASASSTASTRASTSSPGCCRSAAGDLVAARARGAAPADRGPRAAVRRRARRVEGLGQARRDRAACCRPSTGCWSAAGCASRSWPPRATRSADSLLEADQIDACRGFLERRSGKIDAAGRRRGGGGVHRGRADHGRRRRRDSGRPDGPRHRSARRSSCSPSSSPTPAPSSGTARWACSRWRRSRPAPEGVAEAIAGLTDALHRGRRRRLGGGRSGARPRRRPRSATSRPAAGRASSSSRARRCPA